MIGVGKDSSLFVTLTGFLTLLSVDVDVSTSDDKSPGASCPKLQLTFLEPNLNVGMLIAQGWFPRRAELASSHHRARLQDKVKYKLTHTSH